MKIITPYGNIIETDLALYVAVRKHSGAGQGHKMHVTGSFNISLSEFDLMHEHKVRFVVERFLNSDGKFEYYATTKETAFMGAESNHTKTRDGKPDPQRAVPLSVCTPLKSYEELVNWLDKQDKQKTI